MKQKTNTPQIETTVATASISRDLKNSVLIVSVIMNLYILTAWIALQLTNQYDMQVVNILFSR